MVALLSQCYSDTNMTGSEKVQNELTVKKNEIDYKISKVFYNNLLKI